MEHPSLGILEAAIRRPRLERTFVQSMNPRCLARNEPAEGCPWAHFRMRLHVENAAEIGVVTGRIVTEFVGVDTPNIRWSSNMAGWEIHHHWI